MNGASLYYEEQGEGEALVFAHCAPGDSTLWDPQFGPFAQSYRAAFAPLRYDHDSGPVRFVTLRALAEAYSR